MAQVNEVQPPADRVAALLLSSAGLPTILFALASLSDCAVLLGTDDHLSPVGRLHVSARGYRQDREYNL